MGNTMMRVSSQDCTLMAPQACAERKDTGLTDRTSTGKRSRKSNSWASIRPCFSRIWWEEPRAVCNDPCCIDPFSITSTITQNWRKKKKGLANGSDTCISHMKDSFQSSTISTMKTVGALTDNCIMPSEPAPLSEPTVWTAATRGWGCER